MISLPETSAAGPPQAYQVADRLPVESPCGTGLELLVAPRTEEYDQGNQELDEDAAHRGNGRSIHAHRGDPRHSRQIKSRQPFFTEDQRVVQEDIHDVADDHGYRDDLWTHDPEEELVQAT